MSASIYRARQFFAALSARGLNEGEKGLVAKYLPPEAFELFQTMPVGDQRHSLIILQGLLAQGYRDPPLLQAALLHDVAKRRVRLWHRTAVILLNAASKQLLPRLASPDPSSWRYPFYLSLHHPELGAVQAAQAGLDPRAVTLIRQHQSPLAATLDGSDLARWQHALKALDDQN